jgi:hypothetical protein
LSPVVSGHVITRSPGRSPLRVVNPIARRHRDAEQVDARVERRVPIFGR